VTRIGEEVNPGGPAGRGVEEERVSTAYRRYADSAGKRRAWSAANRGNIAMREELLGLLLEAGARELAGQGRVLDIGCGNGFWLERLAEHGVAENRLSGVDVQPERVRRAARAVPRATLATADARHLPLPTADFDLVLLFTVLSSLATHSDARAALLEARRVLAPGGLLLCYEPRLPNPLNRTTVRLRRSDYASSLGSSVRTLPCTVIPQLARRLGPLAPVAYPVLRRVRPLLSHRLTLYRAANDQRKCGGTSPTCARKPG
jgi:SAM-dependent methyltransferase